MRSVAVAVLFMSLFLQEDSADPYYKFKKGTAWVYQVTGGGQKRAVMCVAKEEKDRVTVNLEQYEGDDDKEPSDTRSFVWRIKDGHLMFGSGDEKSNEPDMPVFKLGSKKGDTWKVATGEGDDKKEMTGSHEGTVELKVPAGTYKDVLHTKVMAGELGEVHFYLVPKVGLIKLEVVDVFLAELKEVTERKDVKEATPAQVKANERNASASLKVIATAEADFRSNDRDSNRLNDFWVGDVSGLYRHMGGGTAQIKLIEKAVAEADTAPLSIDGLAKHTVEKPVPYSGYYFKMMATDENGAAYAGDGKKTGADKYHNYGKFGICAYPAEYGKTGKLVFIMNETSTIFKMDPGSAAGAGPVTKYPSDADLAKGWSRMD